MKEVWKDVVGHEGLYEVSNTGKVRSLTRLICVEGRKPYIRKGKELKPIVNRLGYPQISLYSQFPHYKKAKIHRLVAEAFLNNPHNLPEVNHKDEDKLNNHVSNLEFCTHAYNMNYGTMRERSVANRDYKEIGKKSAATQKANHAKFKKQQAAKLTYQT